MHDDYSRRDIRRLAGKRPHRVGSRAAQAMPSKKEKESLGTLPGLPFFSFPSVNRRKECADPVRPLLGLTLLCQYPVLDRATVSSQPTLGIDLCISLGGPRFPADWSGDYVTVMRQMFEDVSVVRNKYREDHSESPKLANGQQKHAHSCTCTHSHTHSVTHTHTHKHTHTHTHTQAHQHPNTHTRAYKMPSVGGEGRVTR